MSTSRSELCELLDRFADGDLSAPEADRFRDHLATCANCQRGLHDLLQMERIAAQAAPAARSSRSSAWSMRSAGLAAAAAVVALVLGVFVVRPSAIFGRDDGDGDLLASLGTTRAVEGRLALVAARTYRAYDVPRSGSAPRSVPLATLAALEAKGAHHEIASIYLAAGDLDRAEEHLDRAAPGPGVESDRAVIALARGRAADAIPFLERALDAAPSDAAAQWNRALALSQLGLELSAAAAFEKIAASGEEGWSSEAAERGRALRDALDRRRASLADADRAGKEMIATGAPLPEAVVRAHPDHARRLFYEAVRAAPDAARLRALEPVAAAIDAVSGGRVLRDRLAATQKLDLAKRKDAATAYAALYAGTLTVPPGERDAFLARMRASGDANLVIGALYTLGPFPAKETAELVRLGEASGDPWFRLLAGQEEAAILRAEGKPFDAEARLLALEPLCTAGDRSLELRCTLRDHFLAEGYAALHLVDAARLRVASERERVRRAQDSRQEGAVIPLEGTVALLDGGYALSKAYLEETLARRPGECAVERFVHLALAQSAANELRPERARAELDAAPRCGEPLSAAALNVEADLARFDGTPERVSALRAEIAEQRRSAATPAAKAQLDFFEGRLLQSTDPAAAETLLRSAVTNADAAAGDPLAAKTRGYAYSTLSVLASARGDHAAVVELLAAEARLAPAPSRCALAVNADDERTVAAILDAAGKADGRFVARRERGPLDVAALVPAKLSQALSGCEEVAALARPPLQGRAAILPPGVAFSFRDGTAAHHGARSAKTRVVISASDPPPSLGLPRLSGAGPAIPGEVRVEGTAATPEAALAVMRDAGEVVIHAHGRVDLAFSGASHLVLSPDREGQFALTADAIAAQRLSGNPVVVLAACHAAAPASHVHEPWSLPSAFLRAGARAVLASTDPIPDRDAARFFDAVLDEIRDGKSPSVALESVRAVTRKTAVPGVTRAWYENVVVFE